MTYDLIVIGSGPAGYVAALRAAQVGMKVALVEKEAYGGLCLNWGCVPMKSLLESARLFERMRESPAWGIDGVDISRLSFNWSLAVRRAQSITQHLQTHLESLYEQHAVKRIRGEARLLKPGEVAVEQATYETKAILLATGTRTPKYRLPVPADQQHGLQDLMALKELPHAITIYTEGPHGIELAQLLAMLGHDISLQCPNARLLEDFDPVLERAIQDRLRKRGVRVEVGAALDAPPKDRWVINTLRREAVIPENALGLNMEDGFLVTDAHLRTSAKGVFAAGDVTGKGHLAHVASAQGLYVVDQLMGHSKPFDPGLYPKNLYLDLEVAQIGQTEPQLKAQNISYKVTRHSLHANAKAWVEGAPEGFLRVLSNPVMGDVLGVQIMGLHATDMISEAAALMTMEGTLFDLAKTLHAHPTVSEVFLEAAREGIEW